MEKLVFTQPELEITRFSVEDVITASGWENEGNGIETPDHDW